MVDPTGIITCLFTDWEESTVSPTAVTPDQFSTLGELLRHLRRQARITQRELAVAVGYSDTQISRIEQNQRVPDSATISALFVPALYIEDEPKWVARLPVKPWVSKFPTSALKYWFWKDVIINPHQHRETKGTHETAFAH